MPTLFIVCIFVNIGMWFERFVITVTSLSRDFLPSSWAYYSPTFWDVSTFVGTFGLFGTMMCLFVRYFPIVAIAEVKAVTPAADPHHPMYDQHSHEPHQEEETFDAPLAAVAEGAE